MVFPYVLIGWSAWTTYQDLQNAAYAHGVFAGINAVLATYGLVSFIGIRHGLTDMRERSVDSLRTSVVAPQATSVSPTTESWEEVLFYGDRGSRDQVPSQVPPSLARSRPELFAPPEEQVSASANVSRFQRELVNAVRNADPDAVLSSEQIDTAAATPRAILDMSGKERTQEQAAGDAPNLSKRPMR
ncbi:MAG: hypothetical protein ACKVHU_07850 [Acidimicrobiales bacterium]